jgi:superfamily II DNA or RNA helicase
LIRRGLYDDLYSFAELEKRIGDLGAENSKIVGDALEVFVESYLATIQKMQAETVWLVGQVPSDIRQQLNLPSDTKGIDGVFRTRTGVLVPYQVKFRSQRAYLTYTEVAPFLGVTERAADRIIFTNSNELAPDVKNRDAMRTVRGIDFDDLTEDDFKAISEWLRDQPTAIPKPIARPYQVEALAKISETFAKSDRAHVVMASGTGKTLLALWAAERMEPKTVLVLVPSLTLLQQTLDEWSRHNNWHSGFTYLCVCCDPTVTSRDETDPVQLNAMDIDFRVDTNPDEVRRFIETDTPGTKIVFSTYQSSPVVSDGVRGLTPFDIAIFDEAHKTTGPRGGLFAHSLSEANIKIRKRLFLTATPRHYDIGHRNREGDFRVVSMDNEMIYGPRAYTLSFGEAARQGIICNYRVVISVVDGQEINDFVLKHGITLVEGDLIGARWVANQIAVERAVEQTGSSRIITFHSRVSSAREFGADTARGINRYLPEFAVFHVNGSQKSSERKQFIRGFREANQALITNARCLTEGIDVPAVDMVAFIDPRHSRIDIAQATGRAMRKSRGSDKAIGYVVIPLFLDRKGGETLEQALERSDFIDVANVLNAMQEQDEDLVQIVREMQEARGRRDVFDPCRLSDKIEVLGPSIDLSTLRINIFAEILTMIGVSWDEMFGRLKLFCEKHGHCQVPRDYEDRKLSKWVQHQRNFANNGSLANSRKERLDAIGFNWCPYDEQWEEMWSKLSRFKEQHGHCRVSSRNVDRELARWVVKQRVAYRDGRLSGIRKDRLLAVGFEFERENRRSQQFITYNEAEEFARKLRLETYEEWFTWIRSQRRESLPKLPRSPQVVYRDQGWTSWAKFLGNDDREERSRLAWYRILDRLKAYKAVHGNCEVPKDFHDTELGNWVSTQRVAQKRRELLEERKRVLDEMGFCWDRHEEAWEDMFKQLVQFKRNHGHCNVSQKWALNPSLGRWVSGQRVAKKASKLSSDQINRLEALGFQWSGLERSVPTV